MVRTYGTPEAGTAYVQCVGLEQRRGRRTDTKKTQAWCVGSRGKLPCASGTHGTQKAGTRSPYVQYGGPIMGVRLSTAAITASSTSGGGQRSSLLCVRREESEAALSRETSSSASACIGRPPSARTRCRLSREGPAVRSRLPRPAAAPRSDRRPPKTALGVLTQSGYRIHAEGEDTA